MLTVLEPCDSEYRVRALLLWPRQGVTSLLIGDIRVPAAASYPQFRSLSFFNIFTFLSPPPSHSLSSSLCPSCSLSQGSALISSQQQTPLFAFQVAALCRSSPTFPSSRGRERDRGRGEDGVCSWCFITAPHPDIWGHLFFSPHEHQRVINRINLRPNFLMITVLMYVNECSLLTHYRQFAWDTHNQTL